MLRGCIVAAVLAASATPVRAYEFWLRSRTIGQAYQLREYKLLGPDVLLGRRRYTQTLALRIWDIGDLSAGRRRARLPDRGLQISWQSFLRVDHDFGSYANGKIAIGNDARRDALDVIPELDESLIELDLLYGFLELTGLADDRLTARLGRIPIDDGWGTTAIDGGAARFELPIASASAHAPHAIAISADAGLRVRAASLLGLSAYELDGTAGAGCREYVEAAAPGTGTWRLIDRNRAIVNNRFASDFEFCPQRERLQPSLGVGVATARTRGWGAELGYRRTWSSTVGLIGTVDRLDFPDRGLYPNEFGQAPTRGVNEEHLHARAHATIPIAAAGGAIEPYANARLSLLHAAIDRFDAGMRLVRDAHALEPSVEYFLPTFDGDSIFNVFSIEPTTDVRLAYRYDRQPTRLSASAWLRRYETLADGTGGSERAFAGGGDAQVTRVIDRRWRAAASALWDDGYGGRRIGGAAEAAWRPRSTLWFRGRAIVLGVAPEDRAKYVTSSAIGNSTWKLGDTAALHAIVEVDRDALHATQLRAIAILDLAFAPEP